MAWRSSQTSGNLEEYANQPATTGERGAGAQQQPADQNAGAGQQGREPSTTGQGSEKMQQPSASRMRVPDKAIRPTVRPIRRASRTLANEIWLLVGTIRPRFGAGAGAAVTASVTLWAAMRLAYASFLFLGLYPLRLVVPSAIGGLLATVCGGVVGCRIYRE